MELQISTEGGVAMSDSVANPSRIFVHRFAFAAYDHIWKKLFCAKTGLFYDRISPDDDHFSHLPSVEEIARQFPNPCGWGTGMEDCSINAGHTLEVLSLMHELGREDVAAEIGEVLRGLRLCEAIHGKNGFLVRGVSHRDGKSCYFNSSRDQITMAVAGLFDVGKNVPTLSDSQEELIKVMLAEMARYCKKTVTRENGYNYLRLDGGRALVSELWDCGVHEMLRLPMVYAACAEINSDMEFRDEALSYMEEGMRVSEMFNETIYWWDFPLIQMQLSLDILRKCPFTESYHARIERLMDKVGVAAHRQFLHVLTQCEQYEGDWNVYNKNWRTLPMRTTAATLQDSPCNAVYDGYTYLNPVYPEEFMRIVEYERSLGNYLAGAMLAPHCHVEAPQWNRFIAFMEKQDFSQCTHAGPFSVLHGYLLGVKRLQDI